MARDLGDRQVKAEDCQKMAKESYVEYAFCKLPMLREVYEGMNDASLLQKVKAKIDATADLWIKTKTNISNFIQECKHRDAYHARCPQNVPTPPSRMQMQNTWQSPGPINLV